MPESKTLAESVEAVEKLMNRLSRDMTAARRIKFYEQVADLCYEQVADLCEAELDDGEGGEEDSEDGEEEEEPE